MYFHVWMDNKSLECPHVYYGSLRQNLHHLHIYTGVPSVNRGKTGKMRMDSGWQPVDTPESLSYFR